MLPKSCTKVKKPNLPKQIFSERTVLTAGWPTASLLRETHSLVVSVHTLPLPGEINDFLSRNGAAFTATKA